jgi:DNA-binding NarL/FixJ family response regulator
MKLIRQARALGRRARDMAEPLTYRSRGAVLGGGKTNKEIARELFISERR